MTKNLRYRGLVIVRRVLDGERVAECRTSKSYSTGFRALNEAEALSGEFKSEFQTTDIAVECVKVVAVCEECSELHYIGTSTRCKICGSSKMKLAEMEEII